MDKKMNQKPKTSPIIEYMNRREVELTPESIDATIRGIKKFIQPRNIVMNKGIGKSRNQNIKPLPKPPIKRGK